MDFAAKLSHLLAHWTEHNEAHAQTYREWADRAKEEGFSLAGEHLANALRAVETVDACLRAARAALPESPLEHPHAHHGSNS